MALETIIIALGSLLALALTAFSLWGAVVTGQLSLTAPVLGHLLAIILPLLTLFNTLFPVRLKTRFSWSWRLTNPAAIAVLLSLLDVSLLTLAAALLQPDLLSCSLENRWHQLFRSKDETAVRAIQDAFECCGLRSTGHEAWPFPSIGVDARECARRFQRQRSCEGPWMERQRGVLTEWILVAVFGLLVKAIVIFAGRERSSWMAASRREAYGSEGSGLERGRITGAEEVDTGGRYLDQPPPASSTDPQPRERSQSNSRAIEEVESGQLIDP